MSDFLSETRRLLVAAARPLDVEQVGTLLAERGDVVFPGRRPGITVAARLRSARGSEGGCYEVGPGLWAAASGDEVGTNGTVPTDDGAFGGESHEAWRADVLRLLDSMGYRGAEPIREGAWRAKIGWGSAETDVLVQLDARTSDLAAEAVREHRQALRENSCLAGVLVCRGRAGGRALAEARHPGESLVTIVDANVVARALQGRSKRRR